MAPVYLNDEQVKQVREEYAADPTMTAPRLAVKWGIHPRTVENIVNFRVRRAAGGPANPRARKVIHVTPEDAKDIVFLYRCGVEVREIADRFPQYGFDRVGYVIKKHRAAAKEDATKD